MSIFGNSVQSGRVIGSSFLTTPVGISTTPCLKFTQVLPPTGGNGGSSIPALGEASRRLREKLGESLSTVQKFDTPLEEATTPSLEALKAYSVAKRTYSEKGDDAAILFYKRAIELDTRFAMAYAGLGVCYSNLEQEGLASQNFQKAYELRDRVSEREKLSISALYYTTVTGELDKAIQTYQLWAQADPREYVPHRRQGRLYSSYLGQHEKPSRKPSNVFV